MTPDVLKATVQAKLNRHLNSEEAAGRIRSLDVSACDDPDRVRIQDDKTGIDFEAPASEKLAQDLADTLAEATSGQEEKNTKNYGAARTAGAEAVEKQNRQRRGGKKSLEERMGMK